MATNSAHVVLVQLRASLDADRLRRSVWPVDLYGREVARRRRRPRSAVPEAAGVVGWARGAAVAALFGGRFRRYHISPSHVGKGAMRMIRKNNQWFLAK